MKRTVVFIIAFSVILFAWFFFRETEEVYKQAAAKAQDEVPVPEAFQTWQRYNSPSGLFSATFPAIPQYMTEVERDDLGVVYKTNEVYVSEDPAGTMFVISFIRYHKDNLPLPADKMLANVMHEMTEAQPGNQLVGFKKKIIDGLQGLEFTIVNQQVQMDTFAFTNRSDIFIVSVIGNLANFNEDAFNRFVESLELK